ncbi:hypothetical protein NL676_007962 [Syzygium grande]|nr:hypothetical protein NL676_007962 [Syzygium grande]
MAERRREATEEFDHISRLPDAVIHHIFSFLPFEDVVKTSVLSKQWRLAWTSTPYINLSPSKGASIGTALGRCTAAQLEKFHLDAAKPEFNILTNTYRWILSAVQRKVKDASLVFADYHYRAPEFLCTCASLVSLRVSNCIFSPDITIHWPSLKKLCLHDVPLQEDQMMDILSGCPVLESLTLQRLRSSAGTCNLRINSRSLRELVIEYFYILSLDVSAPNLLSLRLSVLFVLTGFRLNGASSLEEAELNFDTPTDFHGDFPERLKFLLEQLQHVAKITMGSWCVELLLISSEKAIVDMLFRFKNKDFPELGDFDEKQFWLSRKEFYCVANHLKRVEIVRLVFYYGGSILLLALAKFLLEEAVGLEKMIIDAGCYLWRRRFRRGLPANRHDRCCQVVPTDPHDLQDFHDVIQLQKGCRRASRNAEVIVSYRFNGLPYELWKHKIITGQLNP